MTEKFVPSLQISEVSDKQLTYAYTFWIEYMPPLKQSLQYMSQFNYKGPSNLVISIKSK